MRVGFVYSEMEALGIQHLSSVLKQHGHSTRLFFDPRLFMDTATTNKLLNKWFDYKKELFSEIDQFKPSVVAFSVLSTDYLWAAQFAKQIKERFNCVIVFGGIHPTLDPESVITYDFVDYVILGEGEEALSDLVSNIENQKETTNIQNVWTKNNGKVIRNSMRPLIKDLDSLPFPDKDMFYSAMPYLKPHYTIVTGRGCPYVCTFCCNDSLRNSYNGISKKSDFLRRRSPNNVIEELKQAQSKYQIKGVIFDDSTFTYDKKWLKEFSELYREFINLNCFCWVHPAEINEETVRYLKLMNCRAVQMGVESLNPDIRKKWLRRNYSNKSVETALQLLKKNEIFSIVDNIVGLPEETLEDLEYLVTFYNQWRPEKIYIFELRVFPNTQMHFLYNQYHEKFDEQKSQLLPFTLSSSHNKTLKKITVLILAIHFLPKKVINFLLQKRLYKYFPAFSMYNFADIMPHFLNILKGNRLWAPGRRTRTRYMFFMKKMISNRIRGKRGPKVKVRVLGKIDSL